MFSTTNVLYYMPNIYTPHLYPEWAIFKDMWRDLIWGKRLTLA